MIKNLIVLDFQSHSRSELEFSTGVNVICGLSQSGKTALLRALNWVVNNRPLGDGFIRDGTTESSVTVVVGKDDKDLGVLRVKGEKDSNYTVFDISRKKDDIKDDLVFRAFGSDVPKEVRDIFNLSEINIQDQLSPYFLVLDSPGQVALYIRQISNLEEIDGIISLIGSKVRNTSQSIVIVKTDLEKAEVELKKLQEIDLKFFDLCLSEIEDLLQEEVKVGGDVRILNESLKELEDVQDRLYQIDQLDFVYLNDVLNQCRDLEKERVLGKEEVDRLVVLLTELEQIDSRMISFSPDIEEKLSLVDGLLSKWTILDVGLVGLSSKLEDLENTLDDLSETKVKLDLESRKRDELMGLLTVCPYCGSDLDKESKACLLAGV